MHIVPLRRLTKIQLLELLGMVAHGKVLYRVYRKQFTKEFITEALKMDYAYFKNAKVFSPSDCEKIQQHFQFTSDELKEIK